MKILKAVTNQNSFLHSQRRSLHPGRLTIRSILQDDESSSGDRMASVWHFTTNGRTARIAPRSPPIEFAPSSSPLPYAVFAPTLFEFDPIKSSSPFDWVIFRWVDLWRRHKQNVPNVTSAMTILNFGNCVEPAWELGWRNQLNTLRGIWGYQK